MTLLEKIDLVFKWLYLNSGTNPTLQDIKSGITDKGIDIGEIRDVLLKLKNDNFIYCEYMGDLNHPYHANGHFLINFDGKYFYETVGGFAQRKRIEDIKNNALVAQSQRMEKNDERLVKWTRNLFWGTIAVALGAVGLVVWEMWHFYHSC